MSWTQESAIHYVRDDGANVWQIHGAPIIEHITPGLLGRWYGEDTKGDQTPRFDTAEEAMAALDTPPSPCPAGCGRERYLGWSTCGVCLFEALRQLEHRR